MESSQPTALERHYQQIDKNTAPRPPSPDPSLYLQCKDRAHWTEGHCLWGQAALMSAPVMSVTINKPDALIHTGNPYKALGKAHCS